LFDPLPGLILSHRFRHHREPRYVGVLARLGNGGRIANAERTQSSLSSGKGWIGRDEITHWGSVADTSFIRPGVRRRRVHRRTVPPASDAMVD
jgi:hypothetical protein